METRLLRTSTRYSQSGEGSTRCVITGNFPFNLHDRELCQIRDRLQPYVNLSRVYTFLPHARSFGANSGSCMLDSQHTGLSITKWGNVNGQTQFPSVVLRLCLWEFGLLLCADKPDKLRFYSGFQAIHDQQVVNWRQVTIAFFHIRPYLLEL